MKFHPLNVSAAPSRRIAHAGYAICRTSPSLHALQGSAANTVLGHGVSAGLLAVFSSRFGGVSHGSSICLCEPLNTTPHFCEAL